MIAQHRSLARAIDNITQTLRCSEDEEQQRAEKNTEFNEAQKVDRRLFQNDCPIRKWIAYWSLSSRLKPISSLIGPTGVS